ncbi:hypothetical protein QZH41_006701 [Actinostola sp. cb2023]|nr:hypothetical protein QZH41_006701 [Actinostola sp. cb2023]
MKCQFARYGIPDSVVTVNGPQFASENFKQFAEEWDFDAFPSSSGHQQANGAAESAVKKNTPSESMGTSPAQRLLSRRTKTLLPMTAELLKPQDINIESTKERRKIAQAKQAHYYNKHAKYLEALEGDTVRMRPSPLIKRRLDERSYEVEANDTTYGRNRVDLKKTKENEAPLPSPEQPVAPAPEGTDILVDSEDRESSTAVNTVEVSDAISLTQQNVREYKSKKVQVNIQCGRSRGSQAVVKMKSTSTQCDLLSDGSETFYESMDIDSDGSESSDDNNDSDYVPESNDDLVHLQSDG